MRSIHSLFRHNPFGNKTLSLAAVLSMALTALVLFTPVRTLFGLTLLPTKGYLYGIALSLISVPVMEIAKALGFEKA